MDTLKQTAVTALLNLPDFSEIDDMIAVLKNIKFNHELANLPTSPPFFLEVAKEYIGSLEGPADLSTNPTYLKDWGDVPRTILNCWSSSTEMTKRVKLRKLCRTHPTKLTIERSYILH